MDDFVVNEGQVVRVKEGRCEESGKPEPSAAGKNSMN